MNFGAEGLTSSEGSVSHENNTMSTLLHRTSRYVKRLYADYLPLNRTYHDLTHTQGVVRATGMIGLHAGLSTEEQLVANVAAWFHDTGHTICYQHHEAESERLARAFLALQQATPAFIEAVAGCIRATGMPQRPANLVEAVVCDADLYYLSTSSYDTGQQRLRNEWAYALQQHYTEAEWRDLNGRFFSLHRYHTEYGQTVLEPRKREQFARWLLRSNRKAQQPRPDSQPLRASDR